MIPHSARVALAPSTTAAITRCGGFVSTGAAIVASWSEYAPTASVTLTQTRRGSQSRTCGFMAATGAAGGCSDVAYIGNAPEVGTKFVRSVDTSTLPPGNTLLGWATLHYAPRWLRGGRPPEAAVEAMLDEFVALL